MRFLAFLREAFTVLKKNPKLFIPKIIVSAIYGVSLVLAAFVVKDLVPLLEEALVYGASEQYIRTIAELMPFLLFTIFWLFFSLVVDIFVNAMYPALVLDFKSKKPISLKRAASIAKKRSLTVMPAAFFILFVVVLPLVVVSELAALLVAGAFLFVAMLVSLLIALLVCFVFYYAYPVLVLEEVSVFSGLKKSVSLSRGNASLTIKASIIPLLISLFDFYLAFDIFNPVNFVLFIATRFLIAVLSTYHMVLEPLLYFGVK